MLSNKWLYLMFYSYSKCKLLSSSALCNYASWSMWILWKITTDMCLLSCGHAMKPCLESLFILWAFQLESNLCPCWVSCHPFSWVNKESKQQNSYTPDARLSWILRCNLICLASSKFWNHHDNIMMFWIRMCSIVFFFSLFFLEPQPWTFVAVNVTTSL